MTKDTQRQNVQNLIMKNDLFMRDKTLATDWAL